MGMMHRHIVHIDRTEKGEKTLLRAKQIVKSLQQNQNMQVYTQTALTATDKQ